MSLMLHWLRLFSPHWLKQLWRKISSAVGGAAEAAAVSVRSLPSDQLYSTLFYSYTYPNIRGQFNRKSYVKVRNIPEPWFLKTVWLDVFFGLNRTCKLKSLGSSGCVSRWRTTSSGRCLHEIALGDDAANAWVLFMCCSCIKVSYSVTPGISELPLFVLCYLRSNNRCIWECIIILACVCDISSTLMS